MQQALESTIALLERTPAVLNTLLRELPDEWIFTNEGGKTFNVYQVVGHLIHAERVDWIPRIRTILEFGDSRPFQPFDREGFVDQSGSQRLEEVLDEFARSRSKNLKLLRSLTLQPEDFARRGLHPALGSVTLSQLLATWASHDLTHLHQVTRILAHQYREAVGPWSEYLGVLRCAGHSAP